MVVYRLFSSTAAQRCLRALQLSSSFLGIDTHGTTTDVHILLNGNSIFSGLINGYGSQADFSESLSLVAGDKLDFMVGFGSNFNFSFDSTGLSATLSTQSVPEPCSLALLGTGFMVLLAVRYRKR